MAFGSERLAVTLSQLNGSRAQAIPIVRIVKFWALTIKEEIRVLPERIPCRTHHTENRVRHVTSVGVLFP